MHTFIILGNDIYTLDTAEERALAAAHMRDAGVARRKVWRGGPTDADEAGRDFCADPDGTHGWGFDSEEDALARMTAAFRGER